MSSLKQKYNTDILPKLKEEFGVKNVMAIPRLKKVVINMGVGEAKDNHAIIDKVVLNLTAMSGQKPVVTKAKMSISNFKLAKGQPIGAMVTLRGDRMYDFVEKMITVVLPKVRDFRGVSNKAFDGQGNYTLGLKEQVIFPEVDYKNVDKLRGLEICIVTTAKTREQGYRLLELMGMPFAKN
jgi:large subunit ribosomal protein L5